MSDTSLLLTVLSIPHVYYLYVWTQSKHFMKMCKKYANGMDPVLVFSKTAYIIKIVQFITFGAYVWSLGPFDFHNLTAFRVLLATVLFAAGQVLNAGIYKAIGVNGVYYGCRLGKKVPWVNGFPFNVVPYHPQYLGSVLSIWGMVCLLVNGPQHDSLYFVGLVWSFYYFFSSMVEQFL